MPRKPRTRKAPAARPAATPVSAPVPRPDELEAQAGLKELEAPGPDDFAEALPLELAEPGTSPAELSDREAQLLVKVEDLQRQLEEAKAARVAEALGQGELTQPGTGYWKVELQHALTHVVRAPDRANAWDVYRREMGVLQSEYAPEIRPASREEYRAAQARRHGKRPEEWRLPDD